MRKDNTPNYQTSNSRIQSFKDFEQNDKLTKDDLKKVSNQQIKDHDSNYGLPNKFSKNWNRVTKKYDDDSKDIVDDKVKSIDIEDPKHKYKFADDEVNPNHFFKNNTDIKESNFFNNIRVINNISKKLSKINKSLLNERESLIIKGLVGQVYSLLDDNKINESRNYMHSIGKYCEMILNSDKDVIHELMNNGHDWINDNISIAKSDIQKFYKKIKSNDYKL